MFTNLDNNELLDIAGGWSVGQTFQVIGGGLVVIGSVAGGIAGAKKTGGFSVAAGIVGVGAGTGMILDAFR